MHARVNYQKRRTRSPGSEALSTRQVSQLLGVSVQTVRHWVKDGRITPVCRNGDQAFEFSQQHIRSFLGLPNDVDLFDLPHVNATVGAGEAARMLGIPITRLRSMETSGKLIPAKRSVTNRRLYTIAQISDLAASLSIESAIEESDLTTVVGSLIHRRLAATILGVDVKTLQRWEREKILEPVAQVGQVRFYTNSQIEACKRQRQQRFSSSDITRWLTERHEKAIAASEHSKAQAINALIGDWGAMSIGRPKCDC